MPRKNRTEIQLGDEEKTIIRTAATQVVPEENPSEFIRNAAVTRAKKVLKIKTN